jgi:nucleoid-associated protein YgaU
VATGIGFYASPFQIDIAYLIPVKTLNDDMQQFRASLSYRFGRPQFTEIYYDRALEEASQLDQKVLGLTVQEAELKESLSELEQKRRLAREELENMKGRIEALKEQDLLGQKNAQINQLKERVANLELALSGQRQQVRQLTEKKESIRTHVVVSGDTLQSIAKEYYGDANQWKKIYNANSDKIERGLPKDGSKLVIP